MGRQNRILLIDDDRATLKLLTAILTKQGFLTTAMSNSEEAWRSLQLQPDLYSLVLLDRVMPDLDGVTFLQRMKAEKKNEHDSCYHADGSQRTGRLYRRISSRCSRLFGKACQCRFAAGYDSIHDTTWTMNGYLSGTN